HRLHPPHAWHLAVLRGGDGLAKGSRQRQVRRTQLVQEAAQHVQAHGAAAPGGRGVPPFAGTVSGAAAGGVTAGSVPGSESPAGSPAEGSGSRWTPTACPSTSRRS